MPTALLKSLPTLGFELSTLFCATQEAVKNRLFERFEYTGPEQDSERIEEAYYHGHLGIHLTYQDDLVSEIVIRGRYQGHDIGADDLRFWAGLGHTSKIRGPRESTWRLVDVDDREVFAYSSLLPTWRPNFEALLAKQNDEAVRLLGPSFHGVWLGHVNTKSRVELHMHFSRVDGRLNRLALNLPLGIDVLARKDEFFEWAGIASGSTELEAGGLVYKIRIVRHGIVLDGSVTHWSSPLPDVSTIAIGRDRELSLVEAAALAEAELARRFTMRGPMAEVVDPEQLFETERFYVFHSISSAKLHEQSWLPQSYDPEVGCDDSGFTSSTTPMPLIVVDKKTGRCTWGSLTDRAKFQFRRVRAWIASAIHPGDS